MSTDGSFAEIEPVWSYEQTKFYYGYDFVCISIQMLRKFSYVLHIHRGSHARQCTVYDITESTANIFGDSYSVYIGHRGP